MPTVSETKIADMTLEPIHDRPNAAGRRHLELATAVALGTAIGGNRNHG
jgi:hypothetical protein